MQLNRSLRHCQLEIVQCITQHVCKCKCDCTNTYKYKFKYKYKFDCETECNWAGVYLSDLFSCQNCLHLCESLPVKDCTIAANYMCAHAMAMIKSSGFQKYSICWFFQALCLCLCLCRCLCNCVCLCVCVLSRFLNSFHHKLSEYVWLKGSVITGIKKKPFAVT